MTLQRTQPDSPPDTTVFISYMAGTREHADLLAAFGLEDSSGHPRQTTNPDTLPNPGQNNGTIKRRIQDHPEWSAYLADRHILESAIAARAWVERDDQARQDVLVWRETRRDGSPGATRRRLLKPVSINGEKQAKVRWQFAGQKTDEPFNHIGTLDELKGAIADAGGTVTIVEGEFGVCSFHTMGIRNVIGIYGITTIPKDIASLFDELGVTRFIYYVDNDKAGEDGASNLWTQVRGTWHTGQRRRQRPVMPPLSRYFRGPRSTGGATQVCTQHKAKTRTTNIRGYRPRSTRLGRRQGSHPHCPRR